jgi:hypothetical protein
LTVPVIFAAWYLTSEGLLILLLIVALLRAVESTATPTHDARVHCLCRPGGWTVADRHDRRAARNECDALSTVRKEVRGAVLGDSRLLTASARNAVRRHGHMAWRVQSGIVCDGCGRRLKSGW